MSLRATGEWLDLLRRYEDELASIFIVSHVSVEAASSGEGRGCGRTRNRTEVRTLLAGP